MHITKEVITVPPFATARINLATRNPSSHGDHAEHNPPTVWTIMQLINTFFLPYLSAIIPKITLPIKKIFFIRSSTL